MSLPGGNFVNWQNPGVAVRQCIFTLEEFGAKYLDLKYLLRGDFCLFSVIFLLELICSAIYKSVGA